MRRVSTLLLVALLTGVFAASNIPAASAWDTDETAVAYCLDDGYAYIDVWFFNGEPDDRDDLAMDVVAVDLQSGQSVGLGTVVPQDDGYGRISTGWNELDDGKVRFELTWSDGHGGVDSRRARYSATGDCTPPPTTTTTTTVPEPVIVYWCTAHDAIDSGEEVEAPENAVIYDDESEALANAPINCPAPPPSTTTTTVPEPEPTTTTTAAPKCDANHPNWDANTQLCELPMTGVNLVTTALLGLSFLGGGGGILGGSYLVGRRKDS